MGASNVTAALIAWPRLNDLPMRLLLYMAVTTHDIGTRTQSARLYYGGWEALARALGRKLPDEPAENDDSERAEAARRVRHAADVAVRTAVASLVDAGAITRLRPGGRGKTAEFRLNLDVFGTAQAQGQPAAQAQGQPAAQAQGQPAAQAQGQPAAQAQGQPAAKAQGQPAAKAQGQPAPKEEQRKNQGVPTRKTDHLGGEGYLGDRPAGDGEVSMSAAPRAALALIDQVLGRRPPDRRSWCGSCHEPTRMVWSEPPDGGQCLGLCPTCNLPPGPP